MKCSWCEILISPQVYYEELENCKLDKHIKEARNEKNNEKNKELRVKVKKLYGDTVKFSKIHCLLQMQNKKKLINESSLILIKIISTKRNQEMIISNNQKRIVKIIRKIYKTVQSNDLHNNNKCKISILKLRNIRK